MIWPISFSARLASWNTLRTSCSTLPAPVALAQINAWWFGAPWQPYYLHWDDVATWPDPWQLLSDNIYCEVARGLGILYTVTLLERADLAPASLILTKADANLVQVGKEKYILNWEPNSIVNNNLEFQIQRQYQQHPIA